MKKILKNSGKIYCQKFAFIALVSSLSFSACKKSEELTKSTDGTKFNLKSKSTLNVNGTTVYTSGAYTINFKDDVPGGFNAGVRDKLISTFFATYPLTSGRFNSNAPKTVTIWMNPAYTDIANTGGAQIEINPAYMSNNPMDVDLIVHEGTHVFQAYGASVPGWIWEGVADYVRYKYGIYNDDTGWMIQPYRSSDSYTGGYGTTATFLVWLEQHYTSNIVDQLNTICRNNQYSANTWVSLTGKTIDQLWSDYGQNPGIIGLDVTAGAALTVSKENGSGANSGEGSLKLVDNNADTKLFIAGFPIGLTLKLNLPHVKVVTSYSLTSGNDSPDRDPKGWKLDGSNDNSFWTTLDSRNNQTFTSRKQQKTYSFTNTATYKYYKLTVSANNGSADFQLAEWRIIRKQL